MSRCFATIPFVSENEDIGPMWVVNGEKFQLDSYLGRVAEYLVPSDTF